MTIDEMITHLEYSDIKLDAETQIIAALRAGQAMRNTIKAANCFAHLVDDWDAATTGR